MSAAPSTVSSAAASPARLSPLLALLAVAVLTAFLFPLTAGPVTWDELLYMGIAYEPRPEAWVLNRYGHIYSLTAFMGVIPDPLVATRVWWSACAAASLVALGWSLGCLPGAQRLFAGGVALYLLLTQVTFSWSLGLAYTDYSVMLAACGSTALVLGPVVRERPIHSASAAVLGALLVYAVKSKETGLALAWLATLLLVDRNALGLDAARVRRVLSYMGGAAAALALLFALDGWLLGDPWFSVRPENLEALRKFNAGTPRPDPWTWLTWMSQPDNLHLSALYAGVLLLCAAGLRSLSFSLLLLTPLMVFLLLVAGGLVSNPPVSARYSVPALPLMCVLSAVGAARLISPDATPSRPSAAVLGIGALISLATVAVLVSAPWTQVQLAPPEEFFRRSVLPLAVFGSLAAGTLAVTVSWLRAPLLLLALLMLGYVGVSPAQRLIRSAADGDLRTRATNRMPGLTDLARRAQLQASRAILFDGAIYERELFNRGPWAVRSWLSLSARARLGEARLELTKPDQPFPLDRAPQFDAIFMATQTLRGLEAANSSAVAAALEGCERYDSGDGQVTVLRRAGKAP